ncbi:MAG: FixH family protein [Gammaproteobacteria bacterium]
MTASETAEMPLPWYRQGWPWFIISIPLATVVAGIATLILAIQSPNSMVVDNYYKEGLAINQYKHRLVAADKMGLQGLLRGSAGKLMLQLHANQPVSDEVLQLKIIHSTRGELDQQVSLKRQSEGIYVAELPGVMPAGKWYLQLSPENYKWEIKGVLQSTSQFQIPLTSGLEQ